jgi:tetratricopeptide (TPR) repeat protein
VDLSEEWAAIAGQVGEALTADSGEAAGPAPASESRVQASAAPVAPPELAATYESALDGAVAAEPAGGPPEDESVLLESISAEFAALLAAPAVKAPAISEPAAGDTAGGAEFSERISEDTRVADSRGPLGDVFDEFRAEMDESAEKEDPETHYNLGVAYREMGLIEEAISEFQKVAKSHQRGQKFRYALQCYTLLGLAFMEKGQPSIAVSWYQRALEMAELDPETMLALRYDLGVAQEMAGDTEAAQKSFLQVYGMNIDYRDVAERLAGLGRIR